MAVKWVSAWRGLISLESTSNRYLSAFFKALTIWNNEHEQIRNWIDNLFGSKFVVNIPQDFTLKLIANQGRWESLSN